MTTDDRTCDLGFCVCATVKEKHVCKHFHLPFPSIVQSKSQRLGMTRDAFDKQRDKVIRGAERGASRSATEDKLREIRHAPIKHLHKKGVKV